MPRVDDWWPSKQSKHLPFFCCCDFGSSTSTFCNASKYLSDRYMNTEIHVTQTHQLRDNTFLWFSWHKKINNNFKTFAFSIIGSIFKTFTCCLNSTTYMSNKMIITKCNLEIFIYSVVQGNYLWPAISTTLRQSQQNQ